MSINPFTEDSNEFLPASNVGNFKKLRNTVILPDGTIEENLGSGVIRGILGVGGMATVYEIWNSQLEMSRAVKLLHPNHTEETRQRFQTEIKITAKLHHPNIIEIHAVGQWNGLPYIEMERIDGVTLEQLLSINGALPIEVCTSIAIMIGRALRFAHNQEYVIYGKNYHGVIHRDLKPSNVMIARNGAVKLMDFGIARPTDASIHTTDGSILGTMQYLSPEQLEGKESDVRADIYSLGALLYELITGVKAFPELNVSKLMISKIKNYYKEVNRYQVKVPFKLRRLVHCCLVHDRTRRIQNATDFLSKLSSIHKSLTPKTPESILTQFMNKSATGKRNVLELRKKLPGGIFALLVVSALLVFSIVRFGSDLKTAFFYKEKGTSLSPVAAITSVAVKENSAVLEVNKDELSVMTNTNSRKKASNDFLKKNEKIAQEVQVASTALVKETENNPPDNEELIELFLQEVKKRNFVQALDLYSKIPPDDISEKIVIHQIRALRETGHRKELKEILFSREISDGEVYLEKAKYYIENSEYSSAMQELERCSKTAAANIESGTLRLERLYYTAVCKGKEFDHNPSPAAENAALDSWFELKSELQTSKDHPYYKRADMEMQRITQKWQSLKG
jgi:hypothetical protein